MTCGMLAKGLSMVLFWRARSLGKRNPLKRCFLVLTYTSHLLKCDGFQGGRSEWEEILDPGSRDAAGLRVTLNPPPRGA